MASDVASDVQTPNGERCAYNIYVGHNNFLAVARKFSSPGLGYSQACELCLRLHKAPQKSPAVGSLECLVLCDPTGNRTRIDGLKTRCPNR